MSCRLLLMVNREGEFREAGEAGLTVPIFNSPSRLTAEQRLKEDVEFFGKKAPKLVVWLDQAIPETLTVFPLPKGNRRLLRTINSLEKP